MYGHGNKKSPKIELPILGHGVISIFNLEGWEEHDEIISIRGCMYILNIKIINNESEQ